MRVLLIFILLSLSFSANAKEQLNFTQIKNLKLAYMIGNLVEFPETLQAILLVESSANPNNRLVVGDTVNRFGKRSYGEMQIKLITAKFVIKKFKLPFRFKADEQIIAKLITDKYFNYTIAAYYFRYLYSRYKNWKLAVVAYNRGPTWVDRNRDIALDHDYLKKITLVIKEIIRPFNTKYL